MRDDRAEDIMKVIDDLRDIGNEETIIVEGSRDKDALRILGITGNITVLNDGHSIVETCEMMSREFEKVYILTDWDRKGGELSRVLTEQLTALGTHWSMEERKRIAYLCKKDIKDVESIPILLKRLYENYKC